MSATNLRERAVALLTEMRDMTVPDILLKQIEWAGKAREFLEVLTAAPAGEQSDLVYVPGLWRCAKCKLDLTATTLHIVSGTMSANTSPQACPNKCGPMWRVTERDERQAAQRSYNELYDQHHPLPRPLPEWHDDHGNVMWWSFPINVPPWVGQPGDSDWPGYHTHWTPLPPLPTAPNQSTRTASTK